MRMWNRGPTLSQGVGGQESLTFSQFRKRRPILTLQQFSQAESTSHRHSHELSSSFWAKLEFFSSQSKQLKKKVMICPAALEGQQPSPSLLWLFLYGPSHPQLPCLPLGQCPAWAHVGTAPHRSIFPVTGVSGFFLDLLHLGSGSLFLLANVTALFALDSTNSISWQEASALCPPFLRWDASFLVIHIMSVTTTQITTTFSSVLFPF